MMHASAALSLPLFDVSLMIAGGAAASDYAGLGGASKAVMVCLTKY